MGLVLAQHHVLDPAKILLSLFATLSEQTAEPVGPVQGEQSGGFVPSGGLAAFLEGQDVFPIVELARHDNGLATIEGIGDQAEGQLGKLFFKSLTQAGKTLEFAVLFIGLRVMPPES